jgi:hypothetical protein
MLSGQTGHRIYLPVKADKEKQQSNYSNKISTRAPITTTNTCKGNNWLLDSVALLTDDDAHSPDFKNHYLIAS